MFSGNNGAKVDKMARRTDAGTDLRIQAQQEPSGLVLREHATCCCGHWPGPLAERKVSHTLGINAAEAQAGPPPEGGHTLIFPH